MRYGSCDVGTCAWSLGVGVGVGIEASPDTHQPKPLFPTRAHDRRERGGLQRIVERGDRFAARGFEQLVVAQQIADPQSRQTRLPGAEEVARAAQLQVALGDLEAVGGLGQGLEAGLALVGRGA